MALSMTGFGRSVRDGDDARTAVTLRSVNHKGLKLSVRVSEALIPIQSRLEALVRRRLERGSVTLEVHHRAHRSYAGYRLNQARLRRFYDELTEFAASLGGEPPAFRLEALAQLPGVIEEEPAEEIDADALYAEVAPVVEAALDALVASRTREGQALKDDLLRHIAAMGEDLAVVRQSVSAAVEAHFERARERVRRLLEPVGGAPDDQALLRELAMFADKTDLSEEVARLDEHLAEFERVLQKGGPIGRRVEFLAQELLREANTMSAKTHDQGVLRRVLELKVCAGKIKEQCANLE